MNWNTLTNEAGIEAIKEKSKERPQVIFNHSTRCSISSMAKNRLEKSIEPDGVDFNFLDLIAHRTVSNKIAETFSVYHESPQILLIKDGECVYDESHTGISMDELEAQVK